MRIGQALTQKEREQCSSWSEIEILDLLISKWKSFHGSSATVSALRKVFRDCGMNDMASYLCRNKIINSINHTPTTSSFTKTTSHCCMPYVTLDIDNNNTSPPREKAVPIQRAKMIGLSICGLVTIVVVGVTICLSQSRSANATPVGQPLTTMQQPVVNTMIR